MKAAPQIFIKLVLYSLVIFIVLTACILLFTIQLTLIDLLLPCLLFTAITSISLVVFIVGTGKKTENQPLYSMGAIGIKFFLSMVFALIYFIVLKNTGLFYILLFFLLYLAFTIFLLRVIIKTLKTKSLK